MNSWIFGYGSLIWRPDFAYIERRPATISGWARRFWQGSHDHRGVPEAPGRVVTLIPDPAALCSGMAYQVAAPVKQQVFEQLDVREKNGYQRHDVVLRFPDGATAPGLVYIAPTDNDAYLGPASLAAMAQQIVQSRGPSGYNLDYLRELATALRDLGINDDHVFELERAALAALDD